MFHVTSKQIQKWLNQGIQISSGCAGRVGHVLKVEDDWVYIVKDRTKGDTQRNTIGCTKFESGDLIIPVIMNRKWIILRNYELTDQKYIDEYFDFLNDKEIRCRQALCNQQIAIAHKNNNTIALERLRKIENDLTQAMLRRC